MLANFFMNVKIARRDLNPDKGIAVFIAATDLSYVHQSRIINLAVLRKYFLNNRKILSVQTGTSWPTIKQIKPLRQHKLI